MSKSNKLNPLTTRSKLEVTSTCCCSQCGLAINQNKHGRGTTEMLYYCLYFELHIHVYGGTKLF